MAGVKRKQNEKTLHIVTETETDQPSGELDIISNLLAQAQPAYAADQSGSLLYSNQSYRVSTGECQKIRHNSVDRLDLLPGLSQGPFLAASLG